nr:MAG TPA_asm: hypothetical protein [Caudoviricetes sp.]
MCTLLVSLATFVGVQISRSSKVKLYNVVFYYYLILN